MQTERKRMTPEDVADIMAAEGINRYDALRKRSIEKGNETTAPPVRHLLRDAVQSLTVAVYDWCEDAKATSGVNHLSVALIELMEADVAALIASQVLLDQISIGRPATATAIAIASAMEDEARFSTIKARELTAFKRANKSKHKGHRRKAIRAVVKKVDASWVSWSTRQKLTVGSVMIELFVKSTGMVKIVAPPSRGKRRPPARVEPTQELTDWLRNADEEHRVRYPLYMPTSEPPEDWISPQEGGYSDNIYMRWPLVKVRAKVRNRITPDTCPDFYRAVNGIQNTAWEINRNVFEMVDHHWTEGSHVGGLPRRDPEDLPVKPHDIATNKLAKKVWCRGAAIVHKRNSELFGLRTLASRIHWLADKYLEQPLWFPHKADFRGRVYPVPSFLNPQGGDLAKGLLQFAEAKPVSTTAARAWLSVHGANCWGVDKVSIEDRITWVEDNEKMVREIASDPIIHHTWSEADEPWQFLAWCLDWDALLDAEEAGETYYSKLPVAMDGSNNGLQLYSLMLRDEKGAVATNVSPSDVPQDIYMDVARAATARLMEDSESLDEDVRRYATTWLAFTDGELPRGSTKRPVMVQPYGGTLFSCREYVEEWYEDLIRERGLRDNRPFPTTFEYTQYLAKIIWSCIEDVVIGARAGMDWLRGVADTVARLNRPVEWVSPCGFIVSQMKWKQKDCVVQTKIGQTLLVRRYKADTTRLDTRGMRDGIAPNFIHSVDASILIKTVNRCLDEGITSFAMVHDSYATHAEDAPLLAGILRQVTADIFTKDVLGDFKSQIETAHDIELPPLPEYGNLDPRVVLESRYFFA